MVQTHVKRNEEGHMIKNAVFVLACACAMPVWADHAPGGLEMPNLKPLLDHEAKLVDTLRQYDLREKAFAEWDATLAKQYALAGDPALAKQELKHAEQRYERIQKLYEEVLQRYPNNARALTYYGEILYDFRKDIPKALEEWKMASVIDPKLADPLNDLAIHYCRFGEYSDGLRYFDEALKLEPNNPDFLFNVTQIYLINNFQVGKIKKWSQQKVYREAMKMSKRATDLLPTSYQLAEDYAVNFFAASRFGVKPDWRDAATAWEKARELAIAPDRIFYTWLNEARAWKQCPDPVRERKCLIEARKLRPSDNVVKELLAELDRGKKG